MTYNERHTVKTCITYLQNQDCQDTNDTFLKCINFVDFTRYMGGSQNFDNPQQGGLLNSIPS